ncbi:tetratricopeptide repeat protein [Marilutibacter chinensis]|uniref:Tetratricopeptide repeat protein n=1 Tax=Marilutibacter chinensis TaxID=2912247 RepID=A0ABS9HUI2_9GAMM|nr:tetratricopeptide repeat protein [Lysobacter chinensis]MCF7222042.1 hypothetical protein [Lysobacter chinensis]
MNRTMRLPVSPGTGLFIAFAATCLLYGPGLSGAFIFDDAINFAPLQDWILGRSSWQTVVFGNTSGPLGRSVSMFSFLASASINGLDPLYFKAFNLVIHLLCGWLSYLLLSWALERDARLKRHAKPVAVVLATIWLVHPLHVSTVLYAVQRMAQLSTLFALLAVLVYVHSRERLESDGRLSRTSGSLLFIAFPVLLTAGMLAKENAAVAPLLCLVLETAYFSRNEHTIRPVVVFHSIFVALPALATVGLLMLFPDRLLGGYEMRDFTPLERLLTQPRALVDYLGMWFLPRGGRMGVFTDGFPASTGILAPPITLLAIIALLAISAWVIAARRTRSYLFAGWFFFLGAHAVESSFLPLDLYYEHRNYLPSLGLLLAAGGLLAPSVIGLLCTSTIRRLAVPAGAVAMFAALGLITSSQVRAWQSKEALVRQAIVHHPESIRAAQALIIEKINKGDYPAATRLLDKLTRHPDPRVRLDAHIDMFSVACLAGSIRGTELLDRALTDAPDRLMVSDVQAIGFLVQVSRNDRCTPVRQDIIASRLARLADRASAQADSAKPKYQVRYASAILYSRAGDWQKALEQAGLAAQPGAPNEVLGLLAECHAMTGNRERAQEILALLDEDVGEHDLSGKKMLARLHALLEE